MLVTFDGTTAAGNAAIVGFSQLEWTSVPKQQRKEAIIEGVSVICARDYKKARVWMSRDGIDLQAVINQ